MDIGRWLERVSTEDADTPVFNKAKHGDAAIQKLVDESVSDPFLGDIAKTKKFTDIMAFYIAGNPVGFAIPRRDSDGRYRTGAIYIKKSERNKGYAGLFVKHYFDGKKGRAYIEPHNTASQHLFKSAGFALSGKTLIHDGDKFDEWLLG
jgi:RimJ/RimL family protein N-acetyltransferase